MRALNRDFFTLHGHENDTVEMLKQSVQDKCGIRTSEQRLMFRGKQVQGQCVLKYL